MNKSLEYQCAYENIQKSWQGSVLYRPLDPALTEILWILILSHDVRFCAYSGGNGPTAQPMIIDYSLTQFWIYD
jgi:hypothetical protein